jgi:protocatechuate 3,4-dioxygenase beta subunit
MTGTLEGTVTHTSTGTVFPGVPISFGTQSTTTDSQGHFMFQGIAPGQYRLGVVSGSNYIGTSQTIAVSAGQHIQGAVFSMAFGGSVIGHILDPNGRPRSGATVNLAEWSYRDGQVILNSTRTVVTDDLGGYRMIGLFPGDYAVIAERTYFPGTVDRRQAIPVVVAAETEASGIDFKIQPQPSARISGRVVVPDSNVFGDVSSVLLIPRDPGTPAFTALDKFNNVAARNERNAGGFEIWSVPPGDYDLFVQFPGFRNDSFSGRTAIHVGVDDVSNVVLTVAHGGNLSGHVTVDGAAPLMKLPQLQIVLRAREVAASIPQTTATFATDGTTFTAQNLVSGGYRVIASGLPADAYVSNILQGGRSVFADGVVTIAGDLAPPVEIIIATNGSTVEGNIQSLAGKDVARTIVSLVPAARENIGLYKRSTADASGHFVFRGVAPGDYLIFAWGRIGTDLSEQNAQFLRPYEAQGQRISVQAGNHLQDIPVHLIFR